MLIFFFLLQSLQREQQSPKLERARGGKPVKDITQLYTAAFNKNEKTTDQQPSPVRPRRNDNITKLYTGGFEKENTKVNYKLKPNDELTNPKKVNLDFRDLGTPPPHEARTGASSMALHPESLKAIPAGRSSGSRSGLDMFELLARQARDVKVSTKRFEIRNGQWS